MGEHIQTIKVCESCDRKVHETIVDIDHWGLETRLCKACYNKKYPIEREPGNETMGKDQRD